MESAWGEAEEVASIAWWAAAFKAEIRGVSIAVLGAFICI